MNRVSGPSYTYAYIHRDITCTFRDAKLYILGLGRNHIKFKIINVLIHTHAYTYFYDVKYLYSPIQIPIQKKDK